MHLGGSLTTESACAYAHSPGVPPHPGPEWTRFICISDNHSRTQCDLPPGDVLLHAGDLSSWGYPAQVMKTLDWIKSLDYPTKIIIAGNHDLCLDEDVPPFGEDLGPESLATIREYVRGEEMKKANVHYLEYESFEFMTAAGRKWIVYGSPASPKHASGAFQYSERQAAQLIYDKIPSDTEILITHTPAKYCLDLTAKGKKAGCRVLRERLKSLEACRLHVFGHIHEDAGADMIDTDAGVRVAVNAAIARSGTAMIVDLRN
ncbi:Metallo-dependent phosphatase [Macrolepiota fuliginosa MF-IS2]|uniref:Metallo-dependent phosphatase n=1 Tax=Macrolepiota fuliginosa MF-IS2 TaxID=1400762 RepID=A0A9P5XLB9_9AGAR|nr:Metallo-dependent phosphatase [Macrolepiota fuliginosa MF-IS2]